MEYNKLPGGVGSFGISTKQLRLVLHQLTITSVTSVDSAGKK